MWFILIILILSCSSVWADVTITTTKDLYMSQLHSELKAAYPLCEGLNSAETGGVKKITFRCPGITAAQAQLVIDKHVPKAPLPFTVNGTTYMVRSASEVDEAARTEAAKVGRGGGSTETEKFRLGMWAHYMLDKDVTPCPPTDLTQACVDKRARATTIKNNFTALFDQIDQIYDDAATFKFTQGW